MLLPPYKLNSFVIILCVWSFCLGQNSEIDSSKVKDPSLAWKIAFVPGLGQLYNEKPMKAFILSALKTYWLIDYEKSQKENNISDRNRSLWWLFGLVMYGAIDSYTDSHLDKFSNKKIKNTKKE